ncbi:hypothetical protein KCU88_g138, partial [Aureobasidium melanogenum]
MGVPAMREVQDGALVAIIRPFLGKDRTERGISAGGRLLLSHSTTGEVLSQIKRQHDWRGPEAVRPTWKTPGSGRIPRDFNLTADNDGLLGRPVLIMDQQGLAIGHGIIGRS